MTPAPPATSTDATTATEPVVCPGCDSLLYQQPRSGKSSMLCAGCHATLSWDGRQLQNVNLSRGPQANRAARAIVPIGTNGWAIAASYLALIGMISCGFVGPFDAILREGDLPEVNDAVNALFRAAAERGVHTGRVVGHGAMEDPKDIEDGMVEAIENGARLICVHPLTSDMVFRGAYAMAEPFFKACKRCGF